jgi:hypothetical protein
MKHKGFQAQLMRAEKLRDIGTPYSLPPGSALPVYTIDALPGCPDDWVRGSGSYVCPVAPNIGLWFDWTMNDSHNTAVLPSVKGMNPVTGQKLEGLHLERYTNKCPIHDVDFEGDERFCPKCEYRWPPQSYVCAPNTLWWDGFRQPDGTVRQFFFSAEEARDIASLVIGKENTVPAFGFAFYEPKERRQPPPRPTRSVFQFDGGYGGQIVNSTKIYGSSSYGMSVQNCSMPAIYNLASADVEEKTSGGLIASSPRGDMEKRMRSKSVSVGAGAEIRQDLAEDTLKIEDWKTEPSAVIRLYFVFEEQFKEIVDKGGIRDLKGDDKGFMKDLPVG